MNANRATAQWRLATFNLESLDARARDPLAFAERIDALRPILLKLDADVLCLQEVNAQGNGRRAPRDFRALDALLAGTEYASFARANSVHPDTGRPADVHNLVTLSRWPIVAHRQIFHDFLPVWRLPSPHGAADAAGLDVRFDRPVLIGRIEAPFGALHVFNLHLRAPRAALFAAVEGGGRWRSNAQWALGFHLAALKRQGQALETRLAADAIFEEEPDARIAICGDLNADSFETPTRILCGAPDEGEQDLNARALKALDGRVDPARRYTVIHDGRRVMLDHILASPALAGRCARVEIFNDGLADEAHTRGPVAGSLHGAVLAIFSA